MAKGGGGGTRGHWVLGQSGKEQLIHAIGKGKWAPGPVKGFKAPPRPPLAGRGVKGGVRVNNPLLDPGSNLSGQSLYNAALGLTNAQVNPTLSGLRSQIGVNNRQTSGTIKQVGGLYSQLGTQAQQGVTDQNQIAAALNAQLAQINQQQQGQLQGIGQQGAATLAQYTPQGEGGLGNAAQQSLAAENAKQQGLAAQQTGAMRTFGAQQGANYAGLTAANRANVGLTGTEALRGVSQAGTLKNVPLNQQIGATLANKGALLGTNIGKLRQQEITNRIAQAGVGISQANANTAATNAKTSQFNAATSRTVGLGNLAVAQGNLSVAQAGVRLRAAGLNIQQQNFLANQALAAQRINETGRHDQATEANAAEANNIRQIAAGKKGSVKTFTPGQNSTWFRLVDEATTLIRAAQKAGHPAQSIKDGLSTGQGGVPALSGLQIEAAYELLGWGALLPQTAAALHSVGIRGGTYKGAPIKVRNSAASVGSAVKGGAGALGRGIGSLFH